jgi:hypothetical protein
MPSINSPQLNVLSNSQAAIDTLMPALKLVAAEVLSENAAFPAIVQKKRYQLARNIINNDSTACSTLAYILQTYISLAYLAEYRDVNDIKNDIINLSVPGYTSNCWNYLAGVTYLELN